VPACLRRYCVVGPIVADLDPERTVQDRGLHLRLGIRAFVNKPVTVVANAWAGAYGALKMQVWDRALRG